MLLAFPIYTRLHTQGSNSGAATTPSGVGKLRYRSFYVFTRIPLTKSWR